MSKLKVVVEGTKSDGEKFRKEIETDSEKLHLDNNQLAAVDLSPLAKCTKLQELDLDSSTTIRWDSPNLTIDKLPKGLQKYQEEIKQAWEEFMKAEREIIEELSKEENEKEKH